MNTIDNTQNETPLSTMEQIAQLNLEGSIMELLQKITRADSQNHNSIDGAEQYLDNITGIVQEMIGDKALATEAIAGYFKNTITLDMSREIAHALFQVYRLHFRSNPKIVEKVIDPILKFGLSLKLSTQLNSGLTSEYTDFIGHLFKFDSCMLSEVREEFDLDYYSSALNKKNITLNVEKELFLSKPVAFSDLLGQIRNLNSIVSTVALAQYKIRALNTRSSKIHEGVTLISSILEKEKLEMAIDKPGIIGFVNKL